MKNKINTTFFIVEPEKLVKFCYNIRHLFW